MDRKNKDQKKHGWVVGIGASAGGLEAITQFVSNLPKDFKETLIVAQHLAPHAKSMMVELVARHAPLPVIAAEDKKLLEPAHIYIVPPNFDVDIVDNHIVLTPAGPETRPKPSVDDFFRSLALAYKDRAVGIILSGTGSDGAEGVRAIHAVGGLTLAQDGQSAKYDGMPRSAVETSCIDAILAPEQMAKDLPQILAEHLGRLRFSDNDYEHLLQQVISLLKTQQNRDFSQYKMNTLRRRLAKRMAQVGISSLEEYLDLLKKNPAELSQVGQDFLVSVTQFFRDHDVFEELEKQLLKSVLKKEQGYEFRVWVAGCATGEEAYSIGMMLLDILDRHSFSLFVKIFATDLDPDAILEARSGIYTDKEVAMVPRNYLMNYFDRRPDGRFEVTKKLRDVVVFARQDMIQNPPFVKLDLISCRNVLIYFDNDLQKRIMETFHYALLPSGLLVLGKSESLGESSKFFEPIDRKSKIFERMNMITTLAPQLKSAQGVAPIDFNNYRRRSENGPSLAEKGMARLLAAYSLSGVIIDKECQVLQVLGDVSKFVGFFSTNVDFRLLNLLPKEVGVELPILVRKALQDGSVHKSRRHKIVRGKESLIYYVVVRPLFEPDESASGPNLFLVNFEFKKEKTIAPQNGPALLRGDQEITTRVMELEQELYLTREHLQTVIEELGVANEELQSVNEELSSTNEELQSANEEMETTNEELQSSNEELTTLNEELALKSTELRDLYTGLENIQNSMGSPFVVVDHKLRVVRYNPDALKVFSLTPEDVGTEITKISARCELPGFTDVVSDTIRSGKAHEVVCDSEKHIYQMRSMPYHDEKNKIIGAVLFFFDNTALIRTQEKLTKSEQQINAIIDNSASMICLKDQFGRYLMANRSFREFFDLEDKNLTGRTDRELFGTDLALQFREGDLEVMLKHHAYQREEKILRPSGDTASFLIHRFPLVEKSGDAPYAVGMVAVDITSQAQIQEALKASEARYRAIIEDQAVLVCRHKANGEILFVNSLFRNQFESGEELQLGKSFYSMVEPEEREQFQREIGSLTYDQPVAEHEHRMIRKDGQVRWFRWFHRGIFGSAREPLEFQAVGFDVTDYRTQRNRWIEQEAVFTDIFANTSDLISIYRAEGDQFVLESLNRPAERNLELIFNQPLGKSLHQLYSEDIAKQLCQRFNQVLESGAPEVYDEVLHLPESVKYLSTTLVPIPGIHGEIDRVATLSRDVSGYKTIEKDLRGAKDAAEVANRAKSDFLASMSHELRTPLNVVLGMSHLLQESLLDSEQKGFVGSIERSGRVLLSLIEDVLDISKIESGKIKLSIGVFSIAELIKEVSDLFSIQAAEKGLTLTYHIDKKAQVHVFGDASRLRQVLVNLVGNAIKFTDRGQVEISVQVESVTGNERVFLMSVKDSGIGIKPEHHHKIFQKFSQVESGHARRFGGSGLGLVISQQLILMMRGEVGFESDEGQGSRFWFKVPLTLANSEQVTSKQEAQKGADLKRANNHPSNEGEGLRVLAVDDNIDSRDVIRLFLKRLGHEPLVASSGSEAIDILHQNPVDIVLMDVQMPEMDGYETTRRIRSSTTPKARVPIVALTANAMAGDFDKCREAGMDDYMTKPLRLEILKEMLSRWKTANNGG